MQEKKNVEARRLSRRQFLRLSAGGVVGAAAAGSLLSACQVGAPTAAPAVVKREDFVRVVAAKSGRQRAEGQTHQRITGAFHRCPDRWARSL